MFLFVDNFSARLLNAANGIFHAAEKQPYVGNENRIFAKTLSCNIFGGFIFHSETNGSNTARVKRDRFGLNAPIRTDKAGRYGNSLSRPIHIRHLL